MEKRQITAIMCIPAVSNTGNAFEALTRISTMLGHFYCNLNDNIAILTYNGIISSEHKDKLEEIVKPYNFTLMYVEAYENDERLSDNTINLIDNEKN